jgi:methionyl aminopeptidase
VGIICKSRREIDKIREAGRIVAAVLDEIERAVKPGVTTAQLRSIAESVIERNDGEPVFMQEAGFPSPICTSVNEQVVHGIPGAQRLNDGDIVSVDVGVRRHGYIGDAAKTFPVGTIDADDERLLAVTRECLELAIRAAGPEIDLVAVCGAVQRHAEANGFSVVREFVGHGVGEKLHEPPQVPNFVGPGGARPGTVLRPGMVLAIEPMVNAGTYKVKKLSDGWTVVTKDGRRSAHFEHTVAIVDGGVQVLTLS